MCIDEYVYIYMYSCVNIYILCIWCLGLFEKWETICPTFALQTTSFPWPVAGTRTGPALPGPAKVQLIKLAITDGILWPAARSSWLRPGPCQNKGLFFISRMRIRKMIPATSSNQFFLIIENHWTTLYQYHLLAFHVCSCFNPKVWILKAVETTTPPISCTCLTASMWVSSSMPWCPWAPMSAVWCCLQWATVENVDE